MKVNVAARKAKEENRISSNILEVPVKGIGGIEDRNKDKRPVLGGKKLNAEKINERRKPGSVFAKLNDEGILNLASCPKCVFKWS